jgi:mRNA interferase MazF
MPTFEVGQIVSVPFPYVEVTTTRRRPALVVSQGLGDNNALVWVLMITSSDNRAWPGDVIIPEKSAVTGLRSSSIVRTAKIATVEASAVRAIGKLEPDTMTTVRDALRTALWL